MSEQGAKVVKDDFTNTYMITKGSMVVRAKPNSDQVLVNGKPFKLSVPLLIKDGKPVIEKILMKSSSRVRSNFQN